MNICNNCGNKLGNKTPDSGATWWTGTCNYCNEKNQYVTSPRDYGIYEKKEEDEDVKNLKNILGI